MKSPRDVTRLCAGLAKRARWAFAVEVGRLRADTTSFSVHGQYASVTSATSDVAGESDHADGPAVIGMTYGYSRDHRDDLKQWMLALVSSGEGVPHRS